MLYTIQYTLKSETRENIRRELTNLFLQEKSGLDLDTDGTRPIYKYMVENLGKYSVYLKRPTNRYGFDFVVEVEPTIYFFQVGNYRRHKKPSHNDIVNILINYKAQNGDIYQYLQNVLRQIYVCQNIDTIGLTANFPPFTNYDGEQIPIVVLLCCIKWLFIEQDMTYWNYSGRNMLFSHLQNNGLV